MIAFNSDKCSGCAVCPAVCPQGVIQMKNGKATLTDYHSCMECGACAKNCSYDAIELTKGTGCLAAIIKEDILKITPVGTGCGCGTGSDTDGDCC
jgi:NAD-dependent dihydropyrimidine dehydrogenase PreA subunit